MDRLRAVGAWSEEFPWILDGSGPTMVAAHFTYDRTETLDGVGFVTLQVGRVERPLLEP